MAVTIRGRSRSDPGFWYLWSATAVSGLGDGSRIAAFALFAAALTRNPIAVALVTMAAQLPWLFVGPFTGVLIDRFDRRRMLWVCDVVRAAAMTGFAALTVTDMVTVTVLVVAAFLVSSVETMAENLSQAITPELIGSRSLDSANSWLFGGQFITTEFIGTPLGTFLFSMARVLPFSVDAATFAASAVLIARMRTHRSAALPRRDGAFVAETLDGVRWLMRHRVLRSLCLLMGVMNFAVLNVLGIAVLYALEILHVSGTVYGLLLTLVAAGGMAGLLVAPAVTARIGGGRTLLLAFGLCPLPFLVGGLTSDPLVAAPVLMLVGVSVSLGNVVTTTLRQTLIPRQMFGRVNAAYRLVVNGLAPLGAFAGGIIAQQSSLRVPFYVAAAVFVALTVGGWRLLQALPPPGTPAAVPRDETA